MHQYHIWSGNDACLYKMLILSIMTDFTDILVNQIFIIRFTKFLLFFDGSVGRSNKKKRTPNMELVGCSKL